MIPPVRSESGFTLPEAAVAAGLLASALVALAGLFTLSIQSGFESRTRTSETLLAQQKVEELVHTLRGSVTVIIVTHNMQQAARVSDRTAFMLLGELVETGPTMEMFTTPHDSRTEDYITGRFG